MTFVKTIYGIYLLIPLLLIGALYFYDNKKYLTWIKDCFNLKINYKAYISRLFFIFSVILFALSLLDLRGPQEQINTPLSDQKTVILIDASSSMLVEDVQPNRFKRALTVARHFVKSAVGHQISIILFSDISKRLVPYTDDIDLLDARLAGLENERLRGGGSKISSALRESVQALKLETSNGKPGGNILLITDAEENGEDFKIDETQGVSLALVGIGTVSGGKIPMRTKRGTFSGYKTHMNKEVISKLDENFLNRIASYFKRSKKWVVLSFSMPTEEILSFFRKGSQNSEALDETKIRPVLSQWLVMAGIIFYIISVLFNNLKTYSVLMIIFVLNFSVEKVIAQTELKEEENKKSILDQLDKDWSPQKKQELALELAKKNEAEQASKLYKETENNLTLRAKINYGITLLAQGNAQGLKLLSEALKENASKDVELERLIQSNIKKFLTSDGGGGGNSKNDDNKDKDDKKSDKNGKNKEDQSKGDQDKNEKKGQSDREKENSKDKGKDNDDQNGDEQKDRQITNMAQREREIDKKRKMMKVPALLKQLMQDDRALQSEFIDTETNDKDNSRQKRDW